MTKTTNYFQFNHKRDMTTFMLKRLSHAQILTTLFALTVAPSPLWAGQEATAYPATGKAANDIALYFDKADLTLVEGATRSPKPITQAAENITVITSKEIEAMNAHSLADVLDRVAGINTAWQSGRVMDGYSYSFIQGSREDHVLYMMDGVRLNNSSGGDVNPAIIPVQAIERIEVIKGPASSAWGSSLGGVVNLITKHTGKETTPHGSLRASYGEGNTSEVNGDAAGAVGPLSYYLYADRRNTDGLVDNRYFEDDRLYAKTELALPRAMTLGLTVNHADPQSNFGDYQLLDIDEPNSDRHLFTTAYLNGQLSPDMILNISARRLTRDFEKTRSFLGQGLYVDSQAGDLFYREHYEEETTGASFNLAWTPANHRLSLGAETTRGEVSKDTLYGDWAQNNWASPVFDAVGPAMGENWGVYLNDTITWGKLSVTPGLRYDHHSISEAQTSPSLGVTYWLRDDTLLRVIAARGFVFPNLSFLGISDWAYPGAPGLQPEVIDSYQLGLESNALPYLRLKTTLFVHEVKESWVDNYPWENGPGLHRQGFEVEAETVPVAGFSTVANLTYVRFVPEGDVANDTSTGANLILRYDDQKTLHAELSGRYTWWDAIYSVSGLPFGQPRFNSPLWNLSLSKIVCATSRTTTKLFVTGHNLFDVGQYTDINFQNPGRWLEAGLKFKF